MERSNSALSERPRSSRVGRILKLLAFGALGLALLGALGIAGVIAHYSQNLPSVEQLKSGYAPPQITRILARDGTLLKSVFLERRTVIPFAEIPDTAKLAFLAAEDAHFYEHEGLNYWGMLRALLSNLKAGRTLQGGSTITQQVVKNVLLDPSRTLRRKIRETLLARRLEQYLTKEEIFGLYLNHIYLGHGRYGIEEAARYHFGKKARDLRLDESALLAGLVAAPERYSPRKDPERALARRKYVLGQMLEKGFITQALFDEVAAAPLRLAPISDTESELCPEVVAIAERTVNEVGGTHAVLGGYTVTTTIDPEAQSAARKAVRDNLEAYARRHKLAPPYTAEVRKEWGKPFEGAPKPHRIYVGVVSALNDAAGTIDVRVGSVSGQIQLQNEERYNPQHLLPSAFTRVGAVLRVGLTELPEADKAEEEKKATLRLELGPESALIALDVRSREVLALVGSYEAIPGGLDRSTKAMRQPGSTFKAVTYSYALHSREFTPATMLHLLHPKEGSPSTISLRDAFAQSNNEAAVWLFKRSGPAKVVEWGHALGLKSHLGADESLALGSYEVTPLELTNTYATFASGGEYRDPIFIRELHGPENQKVDPLPASSQQQVLPGDEAYLVTSLLRSVVETGTARAARSLGRPLVGKTGTTNQAKDTWFVGYSTEIIAGVWVGYDDALPLGKGESGSVTALPAWMAFMRAAHERRPATDFPRPSSIVVAPIDRRTGLLPYAGEEDTVEEEFLDGTVPTETALPEAGAGESRADAGSAAPKPAVNRGPSTARPDAQAAPL